MIPLGCMLTMKWSSAIYSSEGLDVYTKPGEGGGLVSWASHKILVIIIVPVFNFGSTGARVIGIKYTTV